MSAEIGRRRQQQRALAELGQAALTGIDGEMLIGQTCALVEVVLSTSHCTIVELDIGGGWRLRGSIGSNSSFDPCDDGSESHNSLLRFTLGSPEPLVFDNLSAEPRFEGRHWLDHHGVEAGVSLQVPGRDRTYGVLNVYSDVRRHFAEDEIEFLSAIADVTGSMLESLRAEEARRIAERGREDAVERFRALVENSSEAIAVVDARGRFIYASAGTRRVLGYSPEEMTGRNFAELVHPDELEYARRRLRDLLSRKGSETEGELRLLSRDGVWRWTEGTYKNLLFDATVRGIVINYRDISARKIAEQQLERLAYRDSLTDLPNRFLFHDRVQHAIDQALRRQRGLAIMYIDLDRFKIVNDTLGHSVGDKLLQGAGQRFGTMLRAGDTMARLGGDEFAILLPDVDRAEDAGFIGRKLLAAMREPFHIDGHELHISASIGISMYPGDGEDLITLLKNADAALYRSKELGRNGVQLFATSMNDRYRNRLELELSLHHAIEHEEFELHYQPIIDRNSRSIRSFEALIRWRRRDETLVNPSEFIWLAEETRLILPIGEWVLRDACRQMRAWRDEGLEGFHVAVNLSAHQIAQPNFIYTVDAAIRDNGLDPSDIELEVTESAALQNLEWTLSVLDQLKSLGVRIAVDDFGTGQSSLVYLKRLPLHTLKLDREFIRDIGNNPDDAAILSSIIHLGHSLNLYVIVEGIETQSDHAVVAAHGCDGMQGFLFGRPIVASDVPALLRSFRYSETSAA
jgi:diguanylate cyclase (GGDEF)-like protein/PAS domain S-box-containing protein